MSEFLDCSGPGKVAEPPRRLALIAHDNKKVDLVAWATARLLERKIGLPVEELLSGPEGGDTQIAARVATREVDAVFFFVDPLSAQPHEPDIRALLRVCNVHNVALATNLATADLIIMAFARCEELRSSVVGSKPLVRHPRFT